MVKLPEVIQFIVGMTGIWSPDPIYRPDHPASIQFSAWLSAFNSGDPEKLKDYHQPDVFPYSAANRDISTPKNELALSKASGGFNAVLVKSDSDPENLVVYIKEKNRPIHARVNITVDMTDDRLPVKSFVIGPVSTPLELIPKDDPRREEYEKAYTKLNSTLRLKVIDGFCDVIQKHYVEPENGEKIIASLKERYANGDYDTYEESEDFSMKLRDDIDETGYDQHMRIVFHEPFQKNGRNNTPDNPDEPGKPKLPEVFELLRQFNFGFGETSFDTKSVPGRTIATLPILGFPGFDPDMCSDSEKVRTAVSDILSAVADSDALLVDLRANHGGSPESVVFILSYFLGDGLAPIHTLDFVDRSGEVLNSLYTTASEKMPVGAKRFGPAKPLYVLTTNETISGGEDMSYNFQAFGRGKVIGESKTTAGAANPVTQIWTFCDEEFGKDWWHGLVPNVKPVHSITGANWEHVGVLSDIVAGEGKWEGVDDAKEVATRLLKTELGPGAVFGEL
ncbi:ClpP/crotonase-like domain-containing protein [Xylariales sp. PMI_506]|nr:ClpP/crotonase-like domain-containing protein [Xylariales sp. PMI_506]